MMRTNIKLSLPKDCGNAPKKRILSNFNVALVNKDITSLLENIAIIIGDEIVEGKEAFMNKLAKLHKDKMTELLIIDIITHGYVASVHGKVIGTNQSFDFCHVYKFTGASKTAKIKEITSYIIPTRE